MTTTPESISAHPLAIRRAALVLWVDAYWNDDAERAFQNKTGKSAREVFGQQLMDRPTPQMPEEYVSKIEELLVAVEKAWGRTLPDVAAEMERDVRDLAYDCAMSAVGHGVGPDDRDGFPDALRDIDIPRCDGPTDMYLPAFRIEDVMVGTKVRGFYSPSEYAAQYGDGRSNALFYSFGQMFDAPEAWYLEALPKIIKERRTHESKRGLKRLFDITKAAGMNAIGSPAIANIQLKD